MTDKRLEQESAHKTPHSNATSGRDWKRVQEYEEELRKISPAFQKIESLRTPQPSAQEWRTFTQKLTVQLESTNLPLMRTLRDRITTTDSTVMRWVWILLSIIALAILAGIITLAWQSSVPIIQQTTAASYQHTESLISADAPHSTIS